MGRKADITFSKRSTNCEVGAGCKAQDGCCSEAALPLLGVLGLGQNKWVNGEPGKVLFISLLKARGRSQHLLTCGPMKLFFFSFITGKAKTFPTSQANQLLHGCQSLLIWEEPSQCFTLRLATTFLLSGPHQQPAAPPRSWLLS